MCMYLCVCVYIYIYIYRERERETFIDLRPVRLHHFWREEGFGPAVCEQPFIYGNRRVYRGGFKDFTREGIHAMGSLPLWGNSKFYLRVRSVPGVITRNPPFGVTVSLT